MIRSVIHLLLHFIVPGAVARWAFKNQWKSAWVIMILTMVIDLDHFFANPVYDPTRCSIGFHPLHTWPALIIYLVLTLIPHFRIVGTGLIIHFILDEIDCLWINYL
jgi:hypothetical protein